MTLGRCEVERCRADATDSAARPGAAFGAELRTRWNPRSAGTHTRDTKALTAVGAELRSVRFCSAGRTDELPTAPDFALTAVADTFGDRVLRRTLDLALIARSLDLYLDVRRAVVAQAATGVEATVADVSVTLATAVKMRLGLLDRTPEFAIAGFAEAMLRKSIDRRTNAAEDSAENARRLADPA